ncbi:MAG: hypothetical protein QXD15_02900 [Thermoplasmata archaeon]
MEISGHIYFIKKDMRAYLNDSLFPFFAGWVALGMFIMFFLHFLYDHSWWYGVFVGGVFSFLFLVIGAILSSSYPYIYLDKNGFTWFQTTIWKWIFKINSGSGIPRFIYWNDVMRVSITPGETMDGFTGKHIKLKEIEIYLKNGEYLSLSSLYFTKEDFDEISQIFEKTCREKKIAFVKKNCI